MAPRPRPPCARCGGPTTGRGHSPLCLACWRQTVLADPAGQRDRARRRHAREAGLVALVRRLPADALERLRARYPDPGVS